MSLLVGWEGQKDLGGDMRKSYIKRKTPLRRTSKQTISKVKKLTWAVFSLMIRVRDCLRTTGCSSWGLCITCGKRYHIKLLQAGHFLPGRHNSNLFYERGTHAQCYNCNINLKGNTIEYMKALIVLYGDNIVDELVENDKKLLKFTIPDLEEMWKDYIQRTKDLEVQSE